MENVALFKEELPSTTELWNRLDCVESRFYH